nr:PREDICTED: F-box/LRR-repeat protein 12 [Lepisosteus oculatus]
MIVMVGEGSLCSYILQNKLWNLLCKVCKRWKRLIRDHRLWRRVDLTKCGVVNSRLLWLLVRRYLGAGLRVLCLRGLLFSVRNRTLLSQPWLQALARQCPKLHCLILLHADLKEVGNYQRLPASLKTLELITCEVPGAFFHSSGVSSGIRIETLVVENVSSFSDQHLKALGNWETLRRLELRDAFRVTEAGIRGCASGHLTQLESLELGRKGTCSTQNERAAAGIAEGLPGLVELTLGGAEVLNGLPCLPRLARLRSLRLQHSSLSPADLLPACQGAPSLRSVVLSDVSFSSAADQDSIQQGLLHCAVTCVRCTARAVQS